MRREGKLWDDSNKKKRSKANLKMAIQYQQGSVHCKEQQRDPSPLCWPSGTRKQNRNTQSFEDDAHICD